MRYLLLIGVVLIFFILYHAIGIMKYKDRENQINHLSMNIKNCLQRVGFLKNNETYKQNIDLLLQNVTLTKDIISNVLENKDQLHYENFGKVYSNVRMLTPYTFMPHLLDSPTALTPALLRTRHRNNVDFVIGIPTTTRPDIWPLKATLDNLIYNMKELEKNKILIVIFIGEVRRFIVDNIVNEIEHTFNHYIRTGLIELLVPDPAYYPDIYKIHENLDDAKWHSKQCLDFMYLMAYAQYKGAYYVQFDDNVSVERDFISIMKVTIDNANKNQPLWILVDFCEHGFIGKVFKTKDLPLIITFIQMFYQYQSIDEIFFNYVKMKSCNFFNENICDQAMTQFWWKYYPSIFNKTSFII